MCWRVTGRLTDVHAETISCSYNLQMFPKCTENPVAPTVSVAFATEICVSELKRVSKVF